MHAHRHLTTHLLLLFALLVGCHSDTTPPPPPAPSTPPASAPGASPAAPATPPALTTITLPSPPEHGWKEDQYVSIVNMNAHPHGAWIELLFNRPVQKESLQIDFEHKLSRTWVSPQLLVLSSKEPLPEGKHTLTISTELRGEDGAIPQRELIETFETTAPPTPPTAPTEHDEAEEPAKRERESSTETTSRDRKQYVHNPVAYFGSAPERKHRDYIASTSPKLFFVSTTRLTKEAQKEAVKLIRRSDSYKEAEVIPSRIIYRGKRKTDLEYNDQPLKHLYHIQPIDPLEVGEEYDLVIQDRRGGAHDTHEFIPLPATFTASVEAHSTNVILSTTHPISRHTLKECVKISPKPRVHQIQPHGGNRSHEIDIYPAMPGMTYTLTLDGCTSDLDTRLSGKKRLKVTLGDYFHGYEPEYITRDSASKLWNPLKASFPRILESEELAKKPALPLLTRAWTKLDIKAQRISESTLVTHILKAGQQEPPLDTMTYTDGTSSQDFRAIDTQVLDLTSILTPKSQGILRLLIPEEEEPTLLVSTDLGITAQHDTIWVTRHSDATPVEGATIKIWQQGHTEPVEVLKTNASGIARSVTLGAPLKQRHQTPPTLITASFEQDTSYLSPYPYKEYYNTSHMRVRHHIETDRGLYRPGETIHVAGWLREWSGSDLILPAHTTLQIELTNPRQDASSCSATLTALGGWLCTFTLPEHASTGDYKIVAKFADTTDAREVAEKTIRVERISPPRFAIHIQHHRDRHRIEGHVQRHAGPLMPDTPIEYAIYSRPIAWTSSEHPKFTFGKDGKGVMLSSGETRSDARGRFRINLSDLPKVTTPHQRWVELSAQDTDGVTIQNSFVWTDLPKMIHGVRFSHQEQYSVKRPVQEIHIDVASIRAGKPEKSLHIKDVTVDFIHQKTHEEWRVGAGGNHERVRVVDREERIHRCKIRRSGRYDSCIYRPGKDGSLIRVSVGGEVVYEDRFFVSSKPRAAADIDTIHLTAQEAYFHVGETARLLLNLPEYSPETTVLLYMEGKHFPTQKEEATTGRQTLWTGVTTLRAGAKTLDIPLDDSIPPQYVNITAHVVQGRIRRRARPLMTYEEPGDTIWFYDNSPVYDPVWDRSFDSGRPTSRTLHTGFEIVPPREEDLPKVAVTPSKPSYLPGEEVQIDVRLGGDSAVAEALVMVVDEGALAMTGHDLKRPHFTHGRDVYHTTPTPSRDSRAHLTTPKEVGLKSNPGGGGSYPTPPNVEHRKEENVTAHVELVALDPDTHSATIRFQAPERISNYRVMVLATKGPYRHDFAKTNASFQVAKPLHVRPSLPPFFSYDDLVTLRALVTASTPGAYEIRAELDDWLVLEGSEATQTIHIKRAGEAVPVSWSVRVDDASSQDLNSFKTRVAIHARALATPQHQDSVEVTRPVRRRLSNALLERWRGKKTAQRIWSQDKVGIIHDAGIRIPLDTDPLILDEDARLTVELHDTPLPYINDLITALNQYPHGCAEQTSTKLHALLTILERKQHESSWVGRANLEKRIEQGLERLKAMISTDGQVSLWPRASRSNPWLTAYVAWVHVRALAILPEAVPPQQLERLLDALERQVKRDALEPLTLAMSHYVLALAKKPEPNHLNALYLDRASYSRETNALLALTYHAMSLTEQRDKLLKLATSNTHQPLSALEDLYSSELRAHSIIAFASASTTDKPDASAMDFMQELPPIQALTTQDKSFLLMALNSYDLKLPETTHPPQLTTYQDDQLVDTFALAAGTPYTRDFSLSNLSKQGVRALSMHLPQDSTRRAFYKITLHARRAAQAPRHWRDLKDSRIYVYARGPRAGQPVKGALKVGEVIAVHHYTYCDGAMYDLAILDPLPPGLERIHDPSNTSLSEQQMISDLEEGMARLPGPFSHDAASTMSFYQETLDTAQGIYPEKCSGFARTSYLARAMTPGTYHIWPAYLELMYHPRYSYFTHDHGETLEIVER